MPARRLILASASPARLAVLRDAGLAPEVIVSGVGEDGIEGLAPDKAVEVLAVRKAGAVADGLVTATHGGPSDALVVGCDTMLAIAGELRGKPRSADEARAWWRGQRGTPGTLLTGHAVIDTASGRVASATATTVVHFGTPTDAEVDAYVASGEPLAVAGAFTIDGRSAPFVDRIEGDHGNVLGLSLPLLRVLLAELGVSVVDLWTRPA